MNPGIRRPLTRSRFFGAGAAFAVGVLLSGCAAWLSPDGEPGTGSEGAQDPVRAEAGRPSGAAGVEALEAPVGHSSAESDRYAPPGVERQPATPPRWMTPVSVPVEMVDPPVVYRPRAAVEGPPYFATEVPTVVGSSFVGGGGGLDDPQPSDARAAPGRLYSTASLAPAAPAPSTSFTSTDFDDNATNTGGFLFKPADPIAAAGPNHVVNVVNVTLRVHEKDGTLLVDTALDDFFAAVLPDTFTFDPKVLFDHYAGRWVVVTLERTDDGAGGSPETSEIFLAVSDDADPQGIWFQVAIDAKTSIDGTDHWADYPGLAVDEEAIYVTANMFEFAADGLDFGGVRLWLVDKGHGSGGFYDGGTAAAARLDPYAGGGIDTVTTQPAHVYGDAPAGVGTFLVSYSGLTNFSTEAVQVVRIDDPLGTPTFTQSFVDFGDVEDFPGPIPKAPQSGTSTLVDTNDRRALHAVWYDDSLWATTTIDPKSGDPDSGEATAYWWEIDTSSLGSLTMADHGPVLGEDIATDTFTFFPSVAVNGARQVAVGFSGSASSIFPGSFYTTREAGDPAGSNSGSATLRAGSAFYVRTFCTRNRWGDYSGVAVDPVDGCFWVYNKHATTQGTTTTHDCDDNGSEETSESGRWSTAYGTFCLTGACPADMLLASLDLTGTQTRKAAVAVRTVEGVTVKTGADVVFRAGSRIVLGDGFKVEDGAGFAAEIVGTPCS